MRHPRHKISRLGSFLILMALFVWLNELSKTQADDSLKSKPKAGAASAVVKVENFSLRDLEGKARELYRQEQARVVVLIFATVGCPIVQKSIPNIKALRDQFASKGVSFWLINCDAHEEASS